MGRNGGRECQCAHRDSTDISRWRLHDIGTVCALVELSSACREGQSKLNSTFTQRIGTSPRYGLAVCSMTYTWVEGTITPQRRQ